MSSAIPVAKTHAAPRGLVFFCFKRPDVCAQSGAAQAPMPLTEERWTQLYKTNAGVNRAIRPVSDQRAFGRRDYWTDKTSRGDCDDYVLTKRKRLIEQGWAPEHLLIALLDTEKRERHVVLLAVTDRGDFVLDNRFNAVMPWQKLSYRWIARQSPNHMLRWQRVALNSDGTPWPGIAAPAAPAAAQAAMEDDKAPAANSI